MVNDVDRGVLLDQWDNCKGFLNRLEAPARLSSQTYADPNPIIITGPNGRRVSYGSTIDSQPSFHTRPASSQTGDQSRAEDTSGNRKSGFNKGGYVFTQANSAPADPDLVAGDVAIWFD